MGGIDGIPGLIRCTKVVKSPNPFGPVSMPTQRTSRSAKAHALISGAAIQAVGVKKCEIALMDAIAMSAVSFEVFKLASSVCSPLQIFSAMKL